MYACIFIPNLTSQQYTALLKCAESFSPNLEPGPDRVIIDIRGLGSLMGTPGQIASRIQQALLATGLPDARIAVASSPHTAATAARGIPGITIIIPGDETRALARLPLSLLNPEPELFDTLAAWGIHTFGDLSRLPEAGLVNRLGTEGLKLHRLARGISPGPLVPTQEAPEYSARLELDYPLDSLESLAFLMARLLNEVCARLVSNGLATTEIRTDLDLENKKRYTRTIRLPYATTDTTALLKLLQLDLAAHPPEAPIVVLSILAEPSPQRRLQGGLFIPVAPDPEKLEVTLMRLAAVVGESNIGSPERLNTHRHDAFRMNHFVAHPGVPTASPATHTKPPLALRLYRPPVPADVIAPYGYPQHLTTARDIRGPVIGYAGPWRSSGEWWRTDCWARDEWDVVLENGGIYRLAREVYTTAGTLHGPELPPLPAGHYDAPAPAPQVSRPWVESDRPAPAPAQPTKKDQAPSGTRPRAGTHWLLSGNYD